MNRKAAKSHSRRKSRGHKKSAKREDSEPASNPSDAPLDLSSRGTKPSTANNKTNGQAKCTCNSNGLNDLNTALEDTIDYLILQTCKRIIMKNPKLRLPAELQSLMAKLDDKAFKSPVVDVTLSLQEFFGSIPDSRSCSSPDSVISAEEWIGEKFEEFVQERAPQKPVNQFLEYTRAAKMVPIGEGYVKVPAQVMNTMDWKSYTICTRKLLTAIFPRNVLATHCLTGKPSPAFPGKPPKKMLDPKAIADIVQVVMQNCKVTEHQVRTIIANKCADECKMLRIRVQRAKASEEAQSLSSGNSEKSSSSSMSDKSSTSSMSDKSSSSSMSDKSSSSRNSKKSLSSSSSMSVKSSSSSMSVKSSSSSMSVKSASSIMSVNSSTSSNSEKQ